MTSITNRITLGSLRGHNPDSNNLSRHCTLPSGVPSIPYIIVDEKGVQVPECDVGQVALITSLRQSIRGSRPIGPYHWRRGVPCCFFNL